MGYPIMGLGFRPRSYPIRLDGCPGGAETTKRPRGRNQKGLGVETAKRPRSNRMGSHLPAGLIGWVFLTKRYVFVRTRAYLRYVEPEGGKPSALYQNPGTISLFDKTIRIRSN